MGWQLEIGNFIQELRQDLGLTREKFVATLDAHESEYRNVAIKLFVPRCASLCPRVYFQRGA
ncbi:hypothetical protein H6F96_26205 [Microcoleus sp. FACHB-53]|nr:hypothetical protein [Microcoleus sp. FACHB-53]MBD2127882.1 hypothetical protein [Microcoleus sp. FACHB-1]